MIIRKEKILIVDDAKFMRITIRKMLEKLGFNEIYEADNVEEALKIYEKRKPDFVTMDITMPGDSGLEGLRRIKEINPKAKILMVSAVSSKNNILQAFSHGAVYFLAKPFTIESFTAVMSKIFDLEQPGAGPMGLSDAKSAAVKESGPVLTLIMQDDNVDITFSESAVIGRCCKCKTDEEKRKKTDECNISSKKRDFIPCKAITISEHQAKITLENGEFFLTPLPESESETKLNNMPLSAGRKYHLMRADVLSFGTADFTVNIK